MELGMSASDKVNILVVDDLPQNLLVMRAVLDELGENVITAQSGAEALQLVLQYDFAVVLLDVNMPGMDGYETAAFIRKRKKSALTPIIFMTAYADEIHKAQGYSLGAVDFLLSPVVPDIVRTKVRVFVELFRMNQEVKRSADERVALAEMEAERSAAEVARAAAEESSRRSAFLAQISSELAGLLEIEATVSKLTRGVVPFLADFAAISVPREGEGKTAELAWLDSSVQNSVQTASGARSLPAFLTKAMERVRTTGKTEVQDLSHCDSKDRESGSYRQNSDAEESLPLHLQCLAILPLKARHETLGTLALGMGPSGRRFAGGDIELAENLAGRAAVFLENARLYQQIVEADRRKNEFLSMLAHELRNPMAPIQNAAEILNAMEAPGEELKWIKGVIDRNVRQLARLVNDLLDISRITQGKIRVEREPIKVSEVVDQAVEISRPLIDSRKHKLAVLVCEEELCVNGDATRLAQALANLLNNAAKYTEPGGRIELRVDGEQHEIVFRVRDSGMGIAQEMLPQIFELFTQIDRSLDRALGGLGIGLSLVRSVIELHDGVVQAFSEGPGKGSEFVVRLPRLDRSTLDNHSDENKVPSPSLVRGSIPHSNGSATKCPKAGVAKEELIEER
jgi:signal transduction histidine kinase/DNA-binding response OmpR family regulator